MAYLLPLFLLAGFAIAHVGAVAEAPDDSSVVRKTKYVTHEQGQAWLAEKTISNENVTVLDTGVQFLRVDKPGWGVWLPKPNCPMDILYAVENYEGKIVEAAAMHYDRAVMDYDMSAIRQVLLRLVEGDNVEIYVPAEYGYENITEDMVNVTAGDPLLVRLKIIQFQDQFNDDLKVQTLTCDLTTLEGCSEREIIFLQRFYRATKDKPERIWGKAERLKKRMIEGKTTSGDDWNWHERQIYLVKQLGKLEDERLSKSEPHLEF